jgi:hypothetical protein
MTERNVLMEYRVFGEGNILRRRVASIATRADALRE